MKGALIATGATLGYLLLITAVLRVASNTRRARLMTRVFLLTIPLAVVIHTLTPANLGVLPDMLVEPNQALDLAFGIFLYCAAFFGGVLQLYNLAERGFSLRILIDIDEYPTRCMDLARVLHLYSAGRGIDWMYAKRIDDMVGSRLISIDETLARNTRSGDRLATAARRLRHLMSLDRPA
jgi:hypothetical protein